MKAALCLASLAILVGAISAAPRSYAWDHGTSYTYAVQSRFAAGLLGLDGPSVDDTETNRAIVELQWKVDIYRGQQNHIYMNPRGFRAVIVKEKIHPRDEPISSQKEVDIPKRFRDVLGKVMLVQLDPKSGVIDSIVVNADSPLTAEEKNLKRSQVQPFILNSGTSNLVVKGNLNRHTNSVRQSDQDDDSGIFYKVLEESIHGECQTYYHLSQTGPFQSLYQLEAQDVPSQNNNEADYDAADEGEHHQQQHPRFAFQQQQQQQSWQQRQNDNEVNSGTQQQPWPQAFKEFCDYDDQVYIIQKTVNLTACTNRPVLSTIMPAELLDCRPGDNSCGSLWNHVVNTRFVACGSDRTDFTIVEVNQEERFVVGNRNDENIDGFAVKNVTLLHKERRSSNPAAQEMKQQGNEQFKIHSLQYEFDLVQNQRQFGGQPSQQQQQWQRQQQQQQQQPWAQQQQWQQSAQQQQWQQSAQQQQWQQSAQQQWQQSAQQQQWQQGSHNQEGSVPQGTNGPITFPLRNHQPTLDKAALAPVAISTAHTQPQLKDRVHELLKEAVRNIHDYRKSIPEGETISLHSILAKIAKYMDKKEIKEVVEEVPQLYHDEEERVTALDTLYDALCNSGALPAITALMEYIEEEQINGPRASQLVMLFPHTVGYPTEPFLQRLNQFIKSRAVQQDTQIRTTALLAESSLVYQACMNARIKQSRYPYNLYGPFCDEDYAEEIVNEAAANLENALNSRDHDFEKQGSSRNHEISLYLAIIGNIGHQKTVKIVQRVLDVSNDPQVKSKAIYALKRLVRSHEENNPIQTNHGKVDTDENQNEVDRVETDPIDDDVVEEKVLPLLQSVALDKTEHPTVRCAAIQLLLYCTYGDVTIYQQLAMSTWFETSNEVHYFIVTSFENLAELEVAPTRQHRIMIVQSRSVLPLCKPLPEDNVSRSSNNFNSGSVEHLTSSFFHQFTTIGSRDSDLPTSAYFRSYVTFGSGAVGVNPIEVAVHLRTLDQVLDQLSQLYGSPSSEESGENNEHLQNILGDINPRKMKENPHGSIYLNIRNDIQRLWQVENLAQYFDLKNNLPGFLALRQRVPFNYQKTIQLAHHTMVMPTILGLPMTYKQRLPVMVSLRGAVRLNAGRGHTQLHAQFDAVAGFKRTTKVSLKIPYLGRKIESGLQSHAVVQVPLRITVSHRSDEPVVVAITPTANINGTQPTGKIELVTFHRHPYVAVIHDELYPTVHSKGGQMTVIRTVDPPTTSQNNMENVLGFSVQTQEESDYRPEKETPEGWATYFSNFGDVESFVHLGSFGGPLAKYSSRKVILNVDESESKTVLFLLAAKRGQSSTDDEFETDNSSPTSESDSSDSTGSSSEENMTPRTNLQDIQDNDSSSSSSSSETNEASNSNEDSAEVLRKGRLIVLGIVTKKEGVPPVTRTPGLINLLKPDYPNQQQYILQLSKRTDKCFLRYAHGSAAEEAARSLPQNSNSVYAIAKAIIDPDFKGQQNNFCSEISAQIQYPKHAHPRLLVALRETLLNNALNAQVQANLQFAQTCKDSDLKQNEINISGQLRRSPNMTEWATSKSPEAQQCQQDEADGFSVSDDCLTVANEQASAFDNVRLDIQWSDNLPEPFQQVVYDAQDVVKAIYYPHVSHDRFPDNAANPNQAIVELGMSSDGEYWSGSVLTSETELQINNVPANDILQAAFPPSAIQSIWQNIEDSYYGSDSQPTCQLEGRTISTFDNVVGTFNPAVAQNCYHLLAVDASRRDSMAILVKNVGTDNLKVQLILPKHKIILSGQRTVSRDRLRSTQTANDITATVNGQTVSLPFTVRQQGQRQQSNDYVARILPHPSGGVQVLTPRNDIAFDGSKLIIFIDDAYRNRTAGLCGDFDGETVAELRSRKDIPLSDFTLLYANYAYGTESNSQCNINQEVKQQIMEEEALALINRNNNGNNQHHNNRNQQRADWQNQTPVQNWSRSNQLDEQDDSSSSEEDSNRNKINRHQQQQREWRQQNQNWNSQNQHNSNNNEYSRH